MAATLTRRYREKRDGKFLCPDCKEWKLVEEFSIQRIETNTRYTYCKPCSAKRGSIIYYRNKSRINLRERNNRYLREYGLSYDDKVAMIEKQNHKCLLCECHITDRAHLDRCHKSGKIRGVLCTNCNRGIGHLKESIKILERAVQYLKLHNPENSDQEGGDIL